MVATELSAIHPGSLSDVGGLPGHGSCGVGLGLLLSGAAQSLNERVFGGQRR
jgi:hypothetical protein